MLRNRFLVVKVHRNDLRELFDTKRPNGGDGAPQATNGGLPQRHVDFRQHVSVCLVESFGYSIQNMAHGVRDSSTSAGVPPGRIKYVILELPQGRYVLH